MNNMNMANLRSNFVLDQDLKEKLIERWVDRMRSLNYEDIPFEDLAWLDDAMRMFRDCGRQSIKMMIDDRIIELELAQAKAYADF